MKHDLDMSVLAAEKVDVADLYRELVATRARRSQDALAGHAHPDAFAQGAECLVDAAAHLRGAADLLLEHGGPRFGRLRELASDLLTEAAAFAHAADLFAAGETTRRPGD